MNFGILGGGNNLFNGILGGAGFFNGGNLGGLGTLFNGGQALAQEPNHLLGGVMNLLTGDLLNGGQTNHTNEETTPDTATANTTEATTETTTETAEETTELTWHPGGTTAHLQPTVIPAQNNIPQLAMFTPIQGTNPAVFNGNTYWYAPNPYQVQPYQQTHYLTPQNPLNLYQQGLYLQPPLSPVLPVSQQSQYHLPWEQLSAYQYLQYQN